MNIQNRKGETALMIAVSNQYINIVIYLIEKGADVTIRNNNGKTALDIAREKNFDKIVSLLEEAMHSNKRIRLY